MEKFVTIPLETVLNSVQKKSNLRTTSAFGLSYIRIIFDDDVDDAFARQQVLSRLGGADLPDGVKPDVQPPYGPTGEIFRYTLKSNTRSIRDLTTIQNWVLDRQFKTVPGVADVNSFGGEERIFEVSVNPEMLIKYNLTSLDVYNAVAKSNVNVGGDVIERNGQAYVVRGIGLLNNIDEIRKYHHRKTEWRSDHGKKCSRCGRIRQTTAGACAARDQEDDVLEGIIVMRKGENPAEVLERIRAKVDELNRFHSSKRCKDQILFMTAPT